MLDPVQLIIVGLAASVLTQVLKFAADKLGWQPKQEVVTVVLFAVAAALAAAFGLPDLPDTGDPAELATALLEAASAVVGVAVVVYKLLLEKVVYPAVARGRMHFNWTLLLVLGLLVLGLMLIAASGGLGPWQHFCLIKPSLTPYSGGGWLVSCPLGL